MSWDEFSDLIGGLNDETALVRVAMIRTENDPERLKDFTPEQRAMRNEWQRKRALKRSEKETQDFMEQMQETLKNLFQE